MKRLFAFIFVFLIAVASKAQKFDGYLYHAAYVPLEITDRIIIDGNIDEWEWVPAKYKITNSNLMNSEQVTKEDLDVEIFFAWSKATNMVYLVASVKDDIVNVDKLGYDDGVHVNINPNKVSGEYWSGVTYRLIGFNIFETLVTPTSEWYNSYIHYGPRWLMMKDYFSFAIKVKDLSDGKHEICYEFGFKIFEDLSLYSSFLSSIATLQPGKIIGLTVAVNDVDANRLERDVQLRTFSGKNFRHQGEEVSNVQLDLPFTPKTIHDELLLISDK